MSRWVAAKAQTQTNAASACDAAINVLNENSAKIGAQMVKTQALLTTLEAQADEVMADIDTAQTNLLALHAKLLTEAANDASKKAMLKFSVNMAAAILQVCRVPVPEAVQNCWRAVFEHLDRVVHRCRDEGAVPTLVVVPDEFQVDQRLCQTLCRRAGYRRADQIDVDLPQRRLAAYAKDRRIQLLDLMPHMRASKTPTYVSDVAQFNEHGNTLAATILVVFMLRT